jgi:hypothetical protein
VQICWGKIPETLEAHLLIVALNLNHYPMLDLNIRLTEAKENGANSTDIMIIVATFPNLAALTLSEKQLHSPRQSSPQIFQVTSEDDLDEDIAAFNTEKGPASPNL